MSAAGEVAACVGFARKHNRLLRAGRHAGTCEAIAGHRQLTLESARLPANQKAACTVQRRRIGGGQDIGDVASHGERRAREQRNCRAAHDAKPKLQGQLRRHRVYGVQEEARFGAGAEDRLDEDGRTRAKAVCSAIAEAERSNACLKAAAVKRKAHLF